VQYLEEMLSDKVKEDLKTEKLELMRTWQTTISLVLIFYLGKNLASNLFVDELMLDMHIFFTLLHILCTAMSYREGYLRFTLYASVVLYFRQIYVLLE
jgi:hypothetical protein